MTKAISTLCAGLALLLFAAAGQATMIQAGYTIDGNFTDPGLVIHTADVAPNEFSVNLDPGHSVYGPLFRIWTEEGSINKDDKVSKDISVTFNFTLPQIFDGSVTGTTVGGQICFILCGASHGELSWDGPADIHFGPKGDGHLKIWLTDATFNWGPVDTIPGEFFGATVFGKMQLYADATAVPEPGVLALFGIGLLGLAATARKARRRS